MHYILDGFFNLSISEISILLIIGIGMLLFTFYYRKQTLKLKNSGLEAEGVIFNATSDGDGGKDLIVRFVTKDKVWITKEPSVYFSFTFPGKKTVGKKVKVFYNPTDPKEFMIDHPAAEICLKIFVVLGIIVTAFGLYSAYLYWIT